MSVVELIKEKLENQDQYEYEIKQDFQGYFFRLGEATARIDWRSAIELDQPHKRVQHTKECLERQSITCPNCGLPVFIERHEALYEGTYYDAFCKECHWSSDDEGGREPINEWLEKNDYYFTCDCPLVEEPPQAEHMAKYLFNALYQKNLQSSRRKTNEKMS